MDKSQKYVKIIKKINEFKIKDLVWFFSIIIVLITTMISFVEYTKQIGLFYKFGIDSNFLLSYEYSINDLLFSILKLFICFIIFYIMHNFKNNTFIIKIVYILLFFILLILITYMTFNELTLFQFLFNLLITKLFSIENIDFIFETKIKLYSFVIIVLISLLFVYGGLNFIVGRFGKFQPKYSVQINNELKIVLYNNNNKSILCNIDEVDNIKVAKIDCTNIITINNENYTFKKLY